MTVTRWAVSCPFRDFVQSPSNRRQSFFESPPDSSNERSYEIIRAVSENPRIYPVVDGRSYCAGTPQPNATGESDKQHIYSPLLPYPPTSCCKPLPMHNRRENPVQTFFHNDDDVESDDEAVPFGGQVPTGNCRLMGVCN